MHKFLGLGEISYIAIDLQKSFFSMIYITWSNVFFVEYNQYAVLRLKNFKTDLDYISIQIILFATSNVLYLVKALC